MYTRVWTFRSSRETFEVVASRMEGCVGVDLCVVVNVVLMSVFKCMCLLFFSGDLMCDFLVVEFEARLSSLESSKTVLEEVCVVYELGYVGVFLVFK